MAERVKIGFVGAGWWATANHLPLLAARDDVELTAVCRLGRAELDQLVQRYGFKFAFEDAGEMLADPRVALDGVFVVSPHPLHFQHAHAALMRGIHVACEKPLCLTGEQARVLVDLADQRGLHLLVPYGWHYKPFIQESRRWLAAGGVGRIEHVQCHMASPIRNLLVGTPVEQAPGGHTTELVFSPDPSTWADPHGAGGGYGHAQLSHATGLLFWLTNLRAEEVFARMSGPGARVDLYDALSVRFEGGALGTVSGSGTVPDGQPFQLELRIFGSEGMLLLDIERERLELRRNDGQDRHQQVAPGSGAYSCEGPPANFIDLIAGRTSENLAPGWCAARSVELLDAAYRSATSGKSETV